VVTGLDPVTTAVQSSPVGSYPIAAGGTPTAANYDIVAVVPGTLSVTPIPTNIVVGSGPGVPATVNVYDTQGQLVQQVQPFGPGFTGGVRTVAADFNGDGTLDYAFGTGPGATALVQVVDGKTGALLFSANPFETFTGGVFVAAGTSTTTGRPSWSSPRTRAAGRGWWCSPAAASPRWSATSGSTTRRSAAGPGPGWAT
jgi:hypothetical protein